MQKTLMAGTTHYVVDQPLYSGHSEIAKDREERPWGNGWPRTTSNVLMSTEHMDSRSNEKSHQGENKANGLLPIVYTLHWKLCLSQENVT